MDNQHNTAIPAEVLEKIQEQINALAKLLKPYLFNLTPEERHANLKLGDKNLAFGTKAYEYAAAHPQFCPSYLDMESFRTDMADVNNLRIVEISLQQLVDGVDDTVMIAGGEAYNQALVFYQAVKQAAKQDIPGAKAIYNELQSHFPSRPTKKKEE